jgi:threonine dehydrogenase-like Zn-dependent dehydrogenase
VKSLITHHFKFEEYAEAYKFIDMHREKCMKVVIDMPENDLITPFSAANIL